MTMTMISEFRIVLVTAPDLETARSLAAHALQSHLAACANLIPQLESHYWWQGRIEQSSEVLLLLKTTTPRLRELEKTIMAHHPYETPEFIVLAIEEGNAKYLEWIASSVTPV